MLKGIHHAAIICSDYEKSKHFYSKVLGLEVIAENYREERDSYKLDLRLPNGSQIELFSFPNSPERVSYPEALGLRHLAFSVSCVDKCIEKLNQAGIVTEAVRVDEFTHQKFTFFTDPDGLPLELYEVS